MPYVRLKRKDPIFLDIHKYFDPILCKQLILCNAENGVDQEAYIEDPCGIRSVAHETKAMQTSSI